MLETLLNIDKELFLLLNGNNSPFWDNFYWIFTSVQIWIPFYITIFVAIAYRQGVKALWTLLFIVVVIILCDQISSSLLKPLFERLRPSHEPDLEGIIRLVNNRKAGLYGFVSSHAANTFGLAMFTSLIFRKSYYTLIVFIWAAINSYSRVYLGLHYPGDILGGLILGILNGFLIYITYKKTIFLHVKGFKDLVKFNNEVLIPVSGVVFSIILILICAKIFIL